MKLSKPSMEGAIRNASPLLTACPSVSGCDVDLQDDRAPGLGPGSGAWDYLPALPARPDTRLGGHVGRADRSPVARVARAAEARLAPATAPATHGPEVWTSENLRITRELHDAVSQKLFAAHLLAGALARSPDATAPVREQAMVLERLNRSAVAEMRMMLFELQPEALSRTRLPELLHQAMEALAGHGAVEVTAELDDSAPLCPGQRLEVYRIATALLSNVARHSGARHAHLQWKAPLQGPAVLRVCDDGCGFLAERSQTPGSGVDRVKKLAASLGAVLSFDSAPGEGTEVTLTFYRSPYES